MFHLLRKYHFQLFSHSLAHRIGFRFLKTGSWCAVAFIKMEEKDNMLMLVTKSEALTALCLFFLAVSDEGEKRGIGGGARLIEPGLY